jgi:hypothetical protein
MSLEKVTDVTEYIHYIRVILRSLSASTLVPEALLSGLLKKVAILGKPTRNC